MKALILNNKVVEVAASEFSVHSSLTWMDAPDGCEAGWELSNGSFVVPAGPTDDEISEQNRVTRNVLLAETDYLALSDNTMSAEMTTYRQALRDITSHANWPNLNEADWPVKPI